MPSTSSASHRALTLMTSVYSLSPAFREASPFTALAIMASPLQLHPAHRRTGERLATSSDHPGRLWVCGCEQALHPLCPMSLMLPAHRYYTDRKRVVLEKSGSVGV